MDPEDDTLDDTSADDAPDGALAAAVTAATPTVAPSVGTAGKQNAVNAFAAARRALQAARTGGAGGMNIGGVDYSALSGLPNGPSDDEQKLTLAKALLSPTAYRGVGATLGNVSGALLQNAQAKRQAQDAQAALLSKYVEAGNVADVNSADKQYSANQSLAARKYAADQALAKAKLVADAKANAPATVGSIEADAINAVVNGTATPQQKAIYNAKYNKPVEGNPERDAVNAVVNGTATPQQQAIYDAKYKQQPTAVEIANIGKAQSTLESADNVIDNLNNALEFNKKAFDGPITNIETGLARWTNPDSEELKATTGLKTALGSNILGNLKATFGGRISNSELAYMQSLQGLQANATRAERETAINYILNIATKRRAQVAQDLAAAQGATATRTGKGPSEPSSVNDMSLDQLLALKAQRAAARAAQAGVQ